jgi:hypothetical protein
MIELTPEQLESIQDGRAVRVRENGREYVVMRPEVYDRLVGDEDDDGQWEPEEMDRLRREAADLLDQDGKDQP